MDGNGRWARERHLPRPLGHRAGMKAVREVVEGAIAAGVEVLTLFAFSEENWQRPPTEISALMELLEEYIAAEVEELRQQGVRVHVLGDRARLGPGARAAVERVEWETRDGARLVLNLCISYSSRAEIARAARLLAEDVLKGTKRLEEIDEEAVQERLYTAPWRDPDLLIRTSGERRLSNFLLWQLAGLGYAAAAVIPFATVWAKGSPERWAEPAIFVGALWLLAVLTTATFARGPERRPLAAVAVTVFGALYASALLAFTVAIRHGDHSEAHPVGSTALVVMPLVLTWICDTCAMAAGTWLGGARLAPVLSPRKTWAGAIGGSVGALAAALLYGPLVLDRVAMRHGALQLVTVGAAVAVAAQTGDVVESLFKREVGLKDSTSLIPGHGGVLDRLDSLYFDVPVTARLFKLFGVVCLAASPSSARPDRSARPRCRCCGASASGSAWWRSPRTRTRSCSRIRPRNGGRRTWGSSIPRNGKRETRPEPAAWSKRRRTRTCASSSTRSSGPRASRRPSARCGRASAWRAGTGGRWWGRGSSSAGPPGGGAGRSCRSIPSTARCCSASRAGGPASSPASSSRRRAGRSGPGPRSASLVRRSPRRYSTPRGKWARRSPWIPRRWSTRRWR